MTLALPIDFDAVRAALVAVVRNATGLDQNHVIMLEPETTLSARPTLPYMTLKFTTVAARMGDDVASPAGDDDDGLFNYGGQRMCSVAFDAYGQTHEQAYAYCHVLQCAFDQEPTADQLDDAGVTFWDGSSVVDVSALLSTGTEGRAHMDCQFGLASNMLVDLGRIETVNVIGTVDTLNEDAVTVTIHTSISKG